MATERRKKPQRPFGPCGIQKKKKKKKEKP
jgi:hypothetical protein